MCDAAVGGTMLDDSSSLGDDHSADHTDARRVLLFRDFAGGTVADALSGHLDDDFADFLELVA